MAWGIEKAVIFVRISNGHTQLFQTGLAQESKSVSAFLVGIESDWE